MKEYAIIDIDRIVRTTPNAVLIEIDLERTWIPQSLIDAPSVVEAYGPASEDVRSLEVEEWFANKEGLI